MQTGKTAFATDMFTIKALICTMPCRRFDERFLKKAFPAKVVMAHKFEWPLRL
jgi:hypothetical protein